MKYMKILLFGIGISLMTLGVNAWAGDDDDEGYYYFDGATVDGAPWTDATTEIITGQTYLVVIDLSYEKVDDVLNEFRQDYNATQTMVIAINSMDVWSATNSSPFNVMSSGGHVDQAEWTMSGNLLYPGTIDPEDVHAAFIRRDPNDYPSRDGLQPLDRNIEVPVTMSNPEIGGNSDPIPEPATVALLGIGLAGLIGVGVRRKMKGKVEAKS